MKKLWKSLCLAICLALCMIPLGEISIEAKVTPSLQDRTANFSRNYTLTTDPGTNMVRIAQAQIGKTYADLGYSEAWCANFVSDCARLASQTAAVPAHSFVPTFSQLIRSAGGTVVVGQSIISTPKAGDIIFYGKIDYPNMYDHEWHVGLVSGYSNGEIYTIEGNANGTDKYNGKVVASRASWSSFPYYYVLRPNYSGSTPQPTKATINIHANGGIEKTKSITVTYGNKCNLSTNFVLRNGYKLKGWNLYRPADNKWFATGKGWFTASEIASKGYQKHLYIPNLSMELESSWYANNSSSAAITNFTFYAIWEPTANTININANGGTTNTSSISVVFGNKFNLSPSFVTRNGYKLKGWNLYRPVDNKWFATGKGWFTASEIASKGYQKHLYIPNLFMGLENSWYGNNSSNAAITNFTFYAIWEPTANTININANGGTTNTSSISVVFGNKCNLSPSFVTRNGYKLKGWNLYRPVDNKWFATGKGWYTAAEITSKGYQKHLYIPNLSMELENSWYGNNSSNAAITNFTFYAIWEVEDIDTNTCSPIASTKYNGKIYELYDNAASWNTANTAATKLGGYLACITSSSENTAIHNLIKNSGSKNCYWIGGSNLNDSQNKFHWVSGESFTYTNWAEKEPSLGTEHFVMMYKSNGLWNVLPVEGANYDSGNMGFIVEKNAPINIDVTGVTLDKSAITLDKGSSTTLTATVAPANATNKTVTWKSSDASVATVDSGKVTAVNAGTATITVTTADGNKTATCKVTVTEKTPGIVNVTSVALDSFSVALEEGGSTTLTATVAPANATNKAVTWKSSNTSVATVNNGTVFAVNAGTAVITVTTADGNKSADCVVIVIKKDPAAINVTGVTLDQTTVSLEEGSNTTLTATVAPANATNKAVTWKTTDASVATVDNGKVTAVKAGTATITVTTADGGKTATCEITVVAKAPEVSFSDVAADAWYVSYVYDLAGKGIINGITPTTFDPEGKITRGQFVKILAYASGDDLSAYSGDSVFADANAHWSKANINWAYTNKIVYGKSDTQFAPDANITRQEMAVMIKRYADYKGITLPQTNAPITFTDEAEIAAWAKEAVSAMQQANIISGFPDGTFAPQGNATRAQAAKMISVFLSL